MRQISRCCGSVSEGIDAGQFLTDDELVRALQNGECDAALTALEARYGARILQFVLGMVRDQHLAQDVTQEALVRLWQHRDRVESETARFWLRRTTHNLCIDRLRRRRSSPEVATELQEEISPDTGAGPARLAESAELGTKIEQALLSLPERDRAVLILREIEGLPYAEIADAVQIPLGTLKARLHRAREQLRARLLRAGVSP